MPDPMTPPRACVEAVRNNDFGPDYATKIATAVLAAFVAGLSEAAIVRMVVAAENGGRPHRVAVENFRAELLKEAQRA